MTWVPTRFSVLYYTTIKEIEPDSWISLIIIQLSSQKLQKKIRVISFCDPTEMFSRSSVSCWKITWSSYKFIRDNFCKRKAADVSIELNWIIAQCQNQIDFNLLSVKNIVNMSDVNACMLFLYNTL